MTFQKRFKTGFGWFILMAFMLATVPILYASTGTASQTQAEMSRDACEKFKKSDAKLNQTYKRILADYQKDKLFIEKMKLAQRAWLAFRDAHLAAVYPVEDAGAQNGSAGSMCQCLELEQLTYQRTKVMQQWIDGTREGDVCAGSIKINRRR